jgi:hypothetical protein
MPGSGFEKIQKINPDGSLKLAGPLVLDRNENETAVRLDVWVFQADNACVTVMHNLPKTDSWETQSDINKDHKGQRFQPGPATAMALVIVKNGKGQTEAYQWTQGVLLDDGSLQTNLAKSV